MAENIWAALSEQLAEASARVGQSVVAVHGGRHVSSGIIFNKDSVVAASHTLRRDEDIMVVTAPGTSVSARVAGRDPSTDLALLRLQQPATVAAPRWGDTSKLRVGELVLALARTRRGNIVASSGILSGLINGGWRTWRGGEIGQFIRPDLVFYRGFSGGPLVNAQGEILGLNTAGLHSSGITVPASTVNRVAAELLEKGRIERPYLGLGMHAVPLQESLRARLNLKNSAGLLVVHVEPDGSADQAGLLLGDVLTELEGKPVTDTGEVQSVLHSAKVGSIVQAGLIRAGTLITVRVKLAARP
jgi:S1-C subfamily serine protease